METDVQTIYNEIAEGGSVSGQHTHLLFSYFKENPRIFQEQMEGCYLKISKYYVQMNKKHRKLYEDVTERIFGHFFKMYEKSRQQNIIDICRHFLQLFSEGTGSSLYMTRVCMSRQLFMLLRAVPPNMLNTVVEDSLAIEMITATVDLFRSAKGTQSKNERGLAIKLSAYLQYLMCPGRSSKFRQCWDVLNSDMFRAVSEEDTSRLRLDALTNIELRSDTFNCIVTRIRDKDIGIRQQVVKKLMKSKILFEEMRIGFMNNYIFQGDRFQLIHDGLKNSSPEVRQQFQNLMLIQFCIIREQEEGNVQQVMVDEENKKQSTIRKRVSLSTNEFQKEVQLMRRSFKRFIGMLEVEKTLIYPQLHDVVVEATRSIIKTYKQTSEVAVYLKDLFEQMSRLQSITTDELFLIRVVITSLRTELDDTLFETIDSHFLDGCQLADYIQSTEYTSLYKLSELVRLASVQINTDQKGRVQLQQVLKRILINYQNLKAIKPQNNETTNDVYEQLSETQIESRWFGQHHFETPVIYDFISFIPFIVKTINILFGSDTLGFAQFIFETVYHDIRQRDMRKCENLLIEKRNIQVKLNVREQEIQKKNFELLEIKKKKGQQKQVELLETELKESIQEKNLLNEKFIQIDTQSLAVLDGLFATVDIHLTGEPIIQKLIETVMQLNKFYNEESDSKIPKLLAFKCLAYIPLFSKEQSRNLIGIFSKVIKQSIEDYPTEQIPGDVPLYIVSLRSLLDYLLLYPFSRDEDIEHVDMITTIAFKSNGVLQCTALEGLAKLILHQRIPDSKVYIAALLFICLDKSTKMSYMQLHIIMTFFRYLITSNLDLLLDFEKGFEVYTCVCCFLTAKNTFKLNTNYLQSGHWQETNILNNGIIGMNMMRFETIKAHESFNKLKQKMNNTQQTQNDYFLGPQEEYLLFLCKMIKDYGNNLLRPLISPTYLDFYDTYDLEGENNGKILIESVIYEIISNQLKQTINYLEEKGKKTDLEIQLLQILETALADRESTEESKLIQKKLEERFDEQKKYTNQLVKFFKQQFIIVEDTTKSRDKDLNDIIQKNPIQYSNENMEEDSEQDDSQMIKLRREKFSDNESFEQKNNDDDESEEISIPTKGKKRAIQKKKGKGKK